jgi:CheY-like chemotaxis protein
MKKAVHFLLVEDNVDHAELVQQTFADCRLDNRLDHVPDGESALAFLRGEGKYAGAPRPDIVLLDLNLPGIGGIEVLRQIKAEPKLKTIPVVVLTTSTADRDRVSAYDCAANSYVSKPVDFDRMMDVVRQLKLYWTICNVPVRA